MTIPYELGVLAGVIAINYVVLSYRINCLSRRIDSNFEDINSSPYSIVNMELDSKEDNAPRCCGEEMSKCVSSSDGFFVSTTYSCKICAHLLRKKLTKTTVINEKHTS